MGDAQAAVEVRRGPVLPVLAGRSRERLVPTAAVLAVASAAWFGLSLAGLTPPTWGWVIAVPSTVVAGLACLAAAASPGLPGAARRFWRGIALGEFLIGVGMAMRAYHMLTSPASARSSVNAFDLVVVTLAVMVEGWALIRLPMGLRSRAQRWSFALDVCTVLAAATLFWWQFVYRTLVDRLGGRGTIVALVTVVLCMAAIFALVKVALTGRHTVDPGALRMFGGAMLFAVVFSVPDSYMAKHTQLTTTQVVLPVAVWLTTLATRRQWRAAAAEAPPRGLRPRRSFSVLPYAAVAATDGLLLVAAGYGHRHERVVIALGVAAVTALVVVRQIMTFRENRRLVERLDRRMEQLRDHERRFRSLVQHSSDVITITGPDGLLTYVSPGITLLGHRVEDLLGQPAAALVHPDDVEVAVQHYRDIADQPGATTTYQARVSHVDGSWRWMEITASNLIHDPGIAGVVGNARDVTQARELRERLSHEASHDALTQLANRTLFGERMGAALEAPASGAAPAGVILVDLNDFKTVNDTLGHAVGDAVLVAVAQRLHRLAPPGATVARLGGDEFALLLPAATGGELSAGADRLVRAFEPPVVVDDRDLPVAASIGYAAGGPGVSPDELLRRADVAMYAAKADGERRQTRCAGYTTSMDRAFSAQTDLERDLRIAIHRGDLHVVYQPIVDLADGRLVAVEALLRWTHPEHGPVPPLQFIPIAERTGLILPLGAQVLRAAGEQAAAWHRRYGELAPAVSVNLSPRQLLEATLAGEVAALLAGADLPPQRLTVEVTESMPVEDPVSLANLDALHRLGVRISLDDFGTGQSALNLLDQCPVDELKLDRSFTRTCTDPSRRKVATAVIQLARTLGLDVVAEGVETATQAEVLFELGYRNAQGYQFAGPLVASEVDARLAAGVPR